jgi:hypothetical protein
MSEEVKKACLLLEISHCARWRRYGSNLADRNERPTWTPEWPGGFNGGP